MEFAFDIGTLWGKRTSAIETDSDLYQPFGTLEDVLINLDFITAEFLGQLQSPWITGHGLRKITVHARLARISGRVFADLFVADNKEQTIPATTLTFRTILGDFSRNQSLTLRLNRCVTPRFSLPAEDNNFLIQGFDFDASADASGMVGYLQGALSRASHRLRL